LSTGALLFLPSYPSKSRREEEKKRRKRGVAFGHFSFFNMREARNFRLSSALLRFFGSFFSGTLAVLNRFIAIIFRPKI